MSSQTQTLALETQLLLQEVTQAKQFEVDVDVVDGGAPPVSEFEAAKNALVEKLRKKKEANRQQQQGLYMKRYGFAGQPQSQKLQQQQAQTTPAPNAAASGSRLSPFKAKQRMAKLPMAAAAQAGSRQKKDFLSKMRTQAIKQGAQEMAKLFGYNSYEDQIKHLNKLEKVKILQSEMKEKQLEAQVEGEGAKHGDDDEDDSSSDFAVDGVEAEEDAGEAEGGLEGAQDETQEVVATDGDHAMDVDMERTKVAPTPVTHGVDDDEGDQAYEETQDLDALEAASLAAKTAVATSPASATTPSPAMPAAASTDRVRRRRNHIPVGHDDHDGNEADSEEDGKSDGETMDVEQEQDDTEAADAMAKEPTEKTKKDKAAGFRQMLQAEAMQNRQHKRLRKGTTFVESEAEEDEEEDVLKIGGLGDFGFGVPQAASKESKDAQDERNALKLRDDDLEGIVDDLSDDEREQQQDLDEIYRRELEEQDRKQVKEVMRNVKEGFGRNRRAFSNLEGGASARGRFNLDELVAADGDKLEAARLGLLESDEDMNDDDDDDDDPNDGDYKERKGKGKEDEEEPNEELDEEAEMERMLRERYNNQPKIYITSSESENESEAENGNDEADQAVKDEIESDEERERQQIKLFSERARINRRMQRMKDLQRQIAKDADGDEQDGEVVANGSGGGGAAEGKTVVLPNLLLEEDEESQSLMKVLNRTNGAGNGNGATKETKGAAGRSKAVGRFHSFGMGASSSSARSTSSFSRVVGNCKLFTAGSGTSTSTKGFVFTSFGTTDKTEQGDENAAPSRDTDDSNMGDAPSSSASLAKSKSWAGPSSSSRAGGKRPFASSNGAASSRGGNKKPKGAFFSVLSSYQCVSQSEQQ